MPFNVPLSPTQEGYVLGGGYSGRDYVLLTPFVPVFRCQPAVASAEDVTFEFLFNNVTVGAYTDVREDMTVFITSGTTLNHFKRPLWRGRISKLPTSDTLFINESSIALNTSHYITVIEQREPVQRLRSEDLIDGWKIFEKLAPTITGLSSSYVKEPTAGEAAFAFSPVAVPMEEGATIVSWLWNIPGGSYTVGSATTQNITVDIPEGHVWITLEVTDSNNTVGSFIFEVFVVERDDPAYVYLGADGAEISNDWSNGVNATLNYFDGAEDILDRTRVTIVTYETYRDGDPEFPNVSFVGYLRQNDDETRGDAQYSTLKTRSYQVAGFSALMGEIKLSQFAANDTAAPAAWDDIELPNAARVIAHMMNRYSTIARLCCIDFGILDNAWYGGDMDIESPFLLDACNSLASEVNAQLIFAPDGQITVQRNLCMQDDTARDAADVIMDIPASRMKVLGHNHIHLPNLAQLIVGFRTYHVADATSTGFTGTAPAIALNEGADFEETPAQLLTADSDDTAARLEATARTANLLAWLDDADEFTVELDDGFRWLQPAQHYWFTLEVAASLMTDGIALTSADRLLLKSVSYKNETAGGTRPVRATFRKETRGGLAMILVEKARSEVPTAMPPRPPMGAYGGAFPPAGTLHTTSQTPPRRPPYAPGGIPGLPYSPAQQADNGDAQPPLGCRIQNPPVNFRNPVDVTTAFTLVNTEPYQIFVKGSAQIATGGWRQSFNMLLSDNGFVLTSAPTGVYTGGVGWEDAYFTSGAFGYRGLQIHRVFSSATITRISMTFSYTPGTSNTLVEPFLALTNEAGPTNLKFQLTVPSAGVQSYVWTGNITTTDLGFFIRSAINTPASDGGGSVTLTNVTIDGTGTNPFTGLPGTADVFADAFYNWTSEDETAVLNDTIGLRLNSTAVAVPPAYNENHEYAIAYTGEGNPLPLKFQDDDYSDNANAILYIAICGQGAGS